MFVTSTSYDPVSATETFWVNLVPWSVKTGVFTVPLCETPEICSSTRLVAVTFS